MKGSSRRKEKKALRMKNAPTMKNQWLMTKLNPQVEEEALELTNQRRNNLIKGRSSATFLKYLAIFIMNVGKIKIVRRIK